MFGRGKKVTVQVTQEDLRNGLREPSWNNPIRSALDRQRKSNEWQVGYDPQSKELRFERKYHVEGRVKLPRSVRKYFNRKGAWKVGTQVPPFSFQIRIPKSMEVGWKG